MNGSSRFAVAVQVFTLLAQAGDEPLTSEHMAGSVNTNPVVIRRVLAALREARLVVSQPGNSGGWRLVRCADRITLRDIYRAVEREPVFPLPDRPPNPGCLVGRNIQGALAGVFRDATRVMEEQLARVTVADVLQSVLSAEASPRLSGTAS